MDCLHIIELLHMTTNKALHSRIVFKQIILENFVHGCTYAAIAWMRRSSEPACRAKPRRKKNKDIYN